MIFSEQIIKSFKQGKAGNCVSIAVIKAAIRQYGINNVFQEVIEEKGKFKIVMRDGFETTLRKHEIEKASKFSRFNKGSDDEIRNKAYFYFAAMAKRVYVEGEIDVFLGRRTLRGALRSLNNGENYMEGIEWLGLNNNYQKVKRNELSSYKNAIGVSDKHCFFIGDGEIVDNWGKPITIIEAEKKDSFEMKYLIGLI